MSRSIRRILVAIKDVRRRKSPAILKAAQLAHALGARLELFHAIDQPLVVDAVVFSGDTVANMAKAVRERCLKRLESLAAPLRSEGLKVEVGAEWDFPAHEAVVRRGIAGKADIIVTDRHEGRHVAPWMLRYTDWELLRRSPVPVLLVKKRRPLAGPRMLAAVDPSHAFGKTAGLDAAILRTAQALCATPRSRLHVVHAFVPSLLDVAPEKLTAPDAPARIVGHAEIAAAARLSKVLRASRLGRLSRAHRHLVARHPVDAIPVIVARHKIEIVAMGLARAGLKGLFIGNTAERLLDDLPCDMLIVKPPGFVSPVPRKARGQRLVSLGPPFGVV